MVSELVRKPSPLVCLATLINRGYAGRKISSKVPARLHMHDAQFKTVHSGTVRGAVVGVVARVELWIDAVIGFGIRLINSVDLKIGATSLFSRNVGALSTTRCRKPEVGHHWKHEGFVISDPRIVQKVEKFLVDWPTRSCSTCFVKFCMHQGLVRVILYALSVLFHQYYIRIIHYFSSLVQQLSAFLNKAFICLVQNASRTWTKRKQK